MAWEDMLPLRSSATASRGRVRTMQALLVSGGVTPRIPSVCNEKTRHHGVTRGLKSSIISRRSTTGRTLKQSAEVSGPVTSLSRSRGPHESLNVRVRKSVTKNRNSSFQLVEIGGLEQDSECAVLGNSALDRTADHLEGVTWTADDIVIDEAKPVEWLIRKHRGDIGI